MIKIEKDIPIPKFRAGCDLTETIRILKRYESILIPIGHPVQTAYTAARRSGIKILSRKTIEGTRIWRIE